MICLTFDVEERFHSHLAPTDTKREWRMERCIAEIVDCLVEHGRTGTFFVVGELAAQYPALVRRMADEGFEVARDGTSPLPVGLRKKEHDAMARVLADHVAFPYPIPDSFDEGPNPSDPKAQESEGATIAICPQNLVPDPIHHLGYVDDLGSGGPA